MEGPIPNTNSSAFPSKGPFPNTDNKAFTSGNTPTQEVEKPSIFELNLVESISSLEKTIIEQCQYMVENGWFKPQSQMDRKRLSSLTGFESAMGNPFTLKEEKVRES